jgi:hypothetical protein
MIPANNTEKLIINAKTTILFAFKDSPSIDISFEADVSVEVGAHTAEGAEGIVVGVENSSGNRVESHGPARTWAGSKIHTIDKTKTSR